MFNSFMKIRFSNELLVLQSTCSRCLRSHLWISKSSWTLSYKKLLNFLHDLLDGEENMIAHEIFVSFSWCLHFYLENLCLQYDIIIFLTVKTGLYSEVGALTDGSRLVEYHGSLQLQRILNQIQNHLHINFDLFYPSFLPMKEEKGKAYKKEKKQEKKKPWQTLPS